jgi:hypothetical protein
MAGPPFMVWVSGYVFRIGTPSVLPVEGGFATEAIDVTKPVDGNPTDPPGITTFRW